MRHQIKINGQRKSASRQGFTLVEVLVALFVFSLLMVIILVPLNMGFTMMHLGKAQSDMQSATQEVVDQMRNDLTHAVYVFPNAQVSPVTDKAPYYVTGTGAHYGPYFEMSGVDTIDPDPTKPAFYNTSGATANACNSNSGGTSNLSRLDMIVAKTDGNSLITPIQPSYYIVSYYARRRDITKDYQPIDNPVILYRAQIPYYNQNGSNFNYLTPTGDVLLAGTVPGPSNVVNADTTNNRYGINCSDRGSWWLAESKFGEPNLQPLTEGVGATNSDPFTLYGSHVSMLPTNIGMVTGVDYRGYNDQTPPQLVTTYTQPKSTFICADTNSDGVIDEVRLNVLLQNATPGSSGSNGRQINLPQVVDLPNVRAFANLH